jgi:small subunit ribosomal protein S21
MLIVKVNGNIEKALKALKNKVIKTQQVQELQRRTEFVKPSVKRRMEIKDAAYRQKKRDEADKSANG